ncbi:MAG: hypothetical protein H7287_12125, partial [Thermoleophilia bacterium]|nr:hypothetical protein [Thermoleophilia bacterium]
MNLNPLSDLWHGLKTADRMIAGAEGIFEKRPRDLAILIDTTAYMLGTKTARSAEVGARLITARNLVGADFALHPELAGMARAGIPDAVQDAMDARRLIAARLTRAGEVVPPMPMPGSSARAAAPKPPKAAEPAVDVPQPRAPTFEDASAPASTSASSVVRMPAHAPTPPSPPIGEPPPTVALPATSATRASSDAVTVPISVLDETVDVASPSPRRLIAAGVASAVVLGAGGVGTYLFMNRTDDAPTTGSGSDTGTAPGPTHEPTPSSPRSTSREPAETPRPDS